MSQGMQRQVAMSRGKQAGIVLMALLGGGALVYLLLLLLIQESPTEPAITAIVPPPPARPTSNKPVVATTVLVDKKPLSPDKAVPARATPIKPVVVRPTDEFVIEGLLSTAGEPWAANSILVKVLWLKNKGQQQFLFGSETAEVRQGSGGFAYRIILRPQGNEFLNWNSGVEGNIGRVVAFLDQRRDGRMSLKQDKVIAVSKELLRYRTGRYDRVILNEIQQQNIRKAGKGYAIVRNIPLEDNRADWRVVASTSPARLDLSASETSLPDLYNTIMKLQ